MKGVVGTLRVVVWKNGKKGSYCWGYWDVVLINCCIYDIIDVFIV